MNLTFTPAIRREAKARVAIIGPTGAGKTWTALEWATTLGGSIAVIDTEHASASLYSDTYTFATASWSPPYDATKLAASIRQAAQQFDVLVIDSLTHFWSGDGGVLDVVEREGAKVGNRGNNFAGWKKGTPIWRDLLDALIFAPCHVIVTMRSKMEYVQTRDGDGRARVEKMGMAPVARNDVEYEFTVVGELDQGHRMAITKSRCSALADQVAAPHQSDRLAAILRDWLSSADDSPAPPPADTTGPTAAQIAKMQVQFGQLGIKAREEKLAKLSVITGRPVSSSKDLTGAEARQVIDALEVDCAAEFDRGFNGPTEDHHELFDGAA